MISEHIRQDRQERLQAIAKIGYGKPVAFLQVDKGHKDGAEEHMLSSTGIITVRNLKTRKVITYIIAYPGQVRRFFPEGQAPEYLINLARAHKSLGHI